MAELKKVLIVDDEKDLANAISAYLTLKGYFTSIALEGRDAFQKARNAQYDIIITDFRMPKLNGAELINSFRSSNLNETTPIILSSGFQDEAIQELKGINLSNVRMLPKPFRMENLLNVVKEIEIKNPSLNANTTPQKLDVNFMNILINSIASVLTTNASVKDIKSTPPKLLQNNKDIKVDISGAMIIMSKNFQGSMSLSFKTSSYLKIVNSLAKEKFESITESNAELMEQILALVTSHMRVELQKSKDEIKKTNPIAFTEPNHELPDCGNPRTLLLTFESSVGTFWVTLVINQNLS